MDGALHGELTEFFHVERERKKKSAAYHAQAGIAAYHAHCDFWCSLRQVMSPSHFNHGVIEKN